MSVFSDRTQTKDKSIALSLSVSLLSSQTFQILSDTRCKNCKKFVLKRASAETKHPGSTLVLVGTGTNRKRVVGYTLAPPLHYLLAGFSRVVGLSRCMAQEKNKIGKEKK